MRWLVVASVVAGVGFSVASAQAAAQPPCVAARVLPSTATTIPANLPAFAYTAKSATATDIHLTVGPGKTDVPLTVGPVADGFLKVVPTPGLVAGSSYELTYTPFCNRGGAPTAPLKFTASAAAPLPASIGVVGATAPTVTLKDFGTTQFTITATYSLAAEFKPWLDVYDVNMEVDGRAIGTTRTVNGDSLQVVGVGWCDEKSAAVPKHPVRMVGKLPFATQATTAATDLEFSCPAAKVGRPPAANPTPGTPLTTVSPDGGTTSVAPSTGTNAGTGTGTGKSDSGGCAMQPRGATSFGGLALVVGLLIATARRRR